MNNFMADSRFDGGAGRGDGRAVLQNALFMAGLFNGGTGRGESLAALTNAAVVPVSFAGGTGRGDATAPVLNQVLPTGAFNGGAGRGDALAGVVIAFPNTVCMGGIGRGDAQAAVQNLPAMGPFEGGEGRGDGGVLTLNTTTPAGRFEGGHGRGDASKAWQEVITLAGLFAGGGGRGDVTATTGAPGTTYVLVALRCLLEGPYDSGTGRMSDALRTGGLLPASEPYTALGYVHAGGGGAESIAPAVLTNVGANAIVDWAVVELRDAVTPAYVRATRSALLQRDGDLVASDGISPLVFNEAPGAYHLAVRHRNHLGTMTQNAIAVGLSSSPLDLTQATTPAFGVDARKFMTGSFPAFVLWAGDVTFDGQLKYTGPANDRDQILSAIGGVVPTNTVNGQYRMEDVNMDGVVKYTGPANDRDVILTNIGGVVPTNTRNAQLP